MAKDDNRKKAAKAGTEEKQVEERASPGADDRSRGERRARRSPDDLVRPSRSQRSRNGTTIRRVVPSIWRSSLTVAGPLARSACAMRDFICSNASADKEHLHLARRPRRFRSQKSEAPDARKRHDQFLCATEDRRVARRASRDLSTCSITGRQRRLVTSALDRALCRNKLPLAEIGNQHILQFRIFEREVGAQLGQIEARALGMHSVFRVDRVDRPLPQRVPPGTIGNDCPAGEHLLLARKAINGVRYFFLTEA